MVKCKDCAYLAIMNRETNQLEEATFQFRDPSLSNLPISPKHGGLRYLRIPFCFPQVISLEIELQHKDDSAEFKRVIHHDRDCHSFREYRAGYSPKEVQQMELVQMERDRIVRLEKTERNWRTQQANEERLWREEQRRIQKQESDQDTALRQRELRWVIIGVLATVTASIVAALLQVNWGK